MAKRFRDLVAKMPPESQRRIHEGAQILLAEMELRDLRKTLRLSQEKIAAVLQIKQSGISKLEQRRDVLLSTLRKYIEALGGELEIAARFPEGTVRINQVTEEDPGQVPLFRTPTPAP